MLGAKRDHGWLAWSPRGKAGWSEKKRIRGGMEKKGEGTGIFRRKKPERRVFYEGLQHRLQQKGSLVCWGLGKEGEIWGEGAVRKGVMQKIQKLYPKREKVRPTAEGIARFMSVGPNIERDRKKCQHGRVQKKKKTRRKEKKNFPLSLEETQRRKEGKGKNRSNLTMETEGKSRQDIPRIWGGVRESGNMEPRRGNHIGGKTSTHTLAVNVRNERSGEEETSLRESQKRAVRNRRPKKKRPQKNQES